MMSGYSLGIDFGTSGARAIAIAPSLIHSPQQTPQIQAQVSVPFAPQTPSSALPQLWKSTLFALLSQIPLEVRRQIRAIAINGTSSTVLVCDPQGTPLGEPLMYNDARGTPFVEQVKAIAPPNHTVISSTSSLAKLFWLAANEAHGAFFLHQADWLSFWLHGKLGISDYHNALKLGYDVEALRYPDWLTSLQIPFQLPQVLEPGEAIAPITADIAKRFGLPSNCCVCAGTTDSIAAFIASRAQTPGAAVTSLGSTLVLKLLSKTRVEDARYGIYSHRLGSLWLVGGASNTGGAVLQQFFSCEELLSLSQQIDGDCESPLHYYPLSQPGERFPINDPQKLPQLEPRPKNPSEFLHGLLEGIARIEAQGYALLMELGASPLTQVYTAGGGAKNMAWMKMRSRQLKVPVIQSAQTEAAFGSALLAVAGIQAK